LFCIGVVGCGFLSEPARPIRIACSGRITVCSEVAAGNSLGVNVRSAFARLSNLVRRVTALQLVDCKNIAPLTMSLRKLKNSPVKS
jgi:hypothetical protein